MFALATRNVLSAQGGSVRDLLLNEVNTLSGQQVELCYHCRKCTAGCPVVDAMQYGPDLLLRMVSLGQDDAVFKSRDIWLCVGCYTCATRCPNEIDIATTMDGLRQMALARGYPAGERDALLFHRLFMGVVQRFGRSHEAFMLGLFKVLSKVPLMNDVPAGIGLFMRGKVPILPENLIAPLQVRQIFAKTRSKK
jgi:heterodisulfide reductase subunit C